jgi:PST family polysaccharide transporter
MLKDAVAKGAVTMAGFEAIAKFMDVISIIVLARLLVPEDFGIVALATATMLIVAKITELPVIEALVQRPELDQRDVDSAFTLNLLRGGVVGAAMVGISWPLAGLYEDDRLVGLISALALVPLAKSFESPALVHVLRKVNYGPTAKSQLFGKVTGMLASVGVALLTGSYWALAVGLIVAALVTMVSTYLFCPYRPRLRFQGIVSILEFAGWVTAARIIIAISQQSDRFFVGYLLGKNVLGQYSMGSQISGMTTYALAGPILRPIFAGMSRIQEDLGRLRSAYLDSQQALMMAVLPFGVGLAAVAEPLVPLLLGEGWDIVVPVIWWVAPVVALQMLSVPVHATAMARGAPQTLALREGIALALRMPTTLAGAWFFGVIGAIVARALSGIMIIVINLFIARSLIGVAIAPQLLGSWRSLVSAGAMAGVVLGVQMIFPEPDIYILALARAVGLYVLGIAFYFALHLLLWRVIGRPDGAESYMTGFVMKKLGRAAA